MSSTAATNNEVPNDRELIKEGSTSMLYPKGRTVFYNPVQVQNRDLSILMISLYAERELKRFQDKLLKKRKRSLLQEEEKKRGGGGNGGNGKEGEKLSEEETKKMMDVVEEKLQKYKEETNWEELHGGITILDALAASGLRSLRYWKEIGGGTTKVEKDGDDDEKCRNSPMVKTVTINDLDPAAVDLAKENIKYNGLEQVLIDDDNNNNTNNNAVEDENKRGIRVQIGDATHVMYTSRRPPNLQHKTQTPTQKLQSTQFNVIDLDPYGSASPFLDSAIQAVTNGGLLAITCTDMAALGGSHPETCYGRYGSMPIPRAKYLQELALRILLGDMSKRAAVYGRTIKPILSVGMNFYVRVFVEVYDDKAGVNRVSTNIGRVYQSVQCPSFHIVPDGQHSTQNKNVVQTTRAPLFPQCPETGGAFKTAGPIWIGPLHDVDVVKEGIGRMEPLVKKSAELSKSKKKKKNSGEATTATTTSEEDGGFSSLPFSTLATHKNIHGLLTAVSEELQDVPLYYTLPDLCSTLKCVSPPMDTFRAAIVNGGYRVSAYHKEPNAVKTDAPTEFIWDILRTWCKEHPPKANGKQRQKRLKKKNNKRKKENDGETTNAVDVSMVEEKVETESNTNEEEGKTENPVQITGGQRILAVEPKAKIDFTIPKEGFVTNKEKRGVARFPMNPEANWGPKPMATGYKKKVEEKKSD